MAILTGVRCCFIVVFICISLIIREIISSLPVGHLHVFLEEISKFSTHSLTILFVFDTELYELCVYVCIYMCVCAAHITQSVVY